MSSVLIIGATSDVAKSTAHRYAREGYDLTLVGRDLESIQLIAEDIKIRYEVRVEALSLDITKFESHDSFVNELKEIPDTAIVFVGYLGDQVLAQSEFVESKKIYEVNLIGVVSICNEIANIYERNGNGTLAVLSSVAGERGRQSNYIYGSAKAGLTAYLSGLRNRLAQSNVHVVTILPGFMATKMTESLELPNILTAKPELVGDRIFKAVRSKKNIVYILWVWRYIMLIIKNIPEFIFKKLKL